jgi:hypothetical protein
LGGSDGERRRRVAQAGGRWRGKAWRGQRGWVSGGRGAGQHVARRGAARGAAEARHMASEGGGAAQREKQSRGAGGRRRGT